MVNGLEVPFLSGTDNQGSSVTEFREDGLTGNGTDEVFVFRVYEEVLNHPSADADLIAGRLDRPESEVRLALHTLVGLKLAKPAPGCCRRFVAVSPEIAEAELVAPLEQAIHHQHRVVSDIRGQLRSFSDTFRRSRRTRQSQDAVRVLDDVDQIRLQLADASRLCESEVLTMQPGGGRAENELHDARTRDVEMLERGVEMKIIYQHTARNDVPTRGYVREVAARGAQVRTSNEIFDRMIIFDRRVAFVPHEMPGGSLGAAVIHEPAMVGLLQRIHEHLWRSASVFDPKEAAYGETFDEVRATILELLASGLKDEVIARRLGMSARTCRRHISRLMSELSAASRFQAGVAAATIGLVGHPE
jgi:DNA-binding CsgD family transcriptional regulator/sugar-specific transcriptional regulator TrmB